MLDYFKTILSKVSFDGYLFEKELKKAIKSLVADEVDQLKSWCYEQFGLLYQSILNQCFSTAA
ncbi:MAG: hypothetical protein KI790_12075 [Cyclobacteriaceae bacterium]|nr:hypothetical protein [Cyclobacteriaceae bacterium HetDA_MAG_MS6]